MRKILLLIFLTLSLFAVWASFSLGFFKKVSIVESDYPEIKLIFKDHVGPYHKIIDAIEPVEKWAQENKIPCDKSFGQYLDDPEIVDHDRLKSRGGCIVSEVPNTLPEGFQSLVVPAQKYVLAEFLGSPAIGPYKVYNHIAAYFNERHWERELAVLEIYERYNKDQIKTIYLFKKK